MPISKKILITGGTGFAGSHLVEYLLTLPDAGSTEIHVTKYGSGADFVETLLPNNQVHQLNLTDEAATAELITKIQPDEIYHLAAIASVGNTFQSPAKVIEVNMSLQISLLEAIKNHAPEARTVIMGSAQEYDCISVPAIDPISELHPLGPSNPYGISKVDQDLLALSYFYSYRLPIIRVRPFNHIGERQTPQFAVPAFAKQIAEISKANQSNPEIKVGNLDAVRDFTDVKDMVRAYVLLMEKGTIGEVYNIGSGQGHSMHSILDILLSQVNTPISVKTDPNLLRPLDVPVIIADNTKIKKLGWQPSISIEETLSRVLNYWKDQP